MRASFAPSGHTSPSGGKTNAGWRAVGYGHAIRAVSDNGRRAGANPVQPLPLAGQAEQRQSRPRLVDCRDQRWRHPGVRLRRTVAHRHPHAAGSRQNGARPLHPMAANGRRRWNSHQHRSRHQPTVGCLPPALPIRLTMDTGVPHGQRRTGYALRIRHQRYRLGHRPPAAISQPMAAVAIAGAAIGYYHRHDARLNPASPLRQRTPPLLPPRRRHTTTPTRANHHDQSTAYYATPQTEPHPRWSTNPTFPTARSGIWTTWRYSGAWPPAACI